MDDIDESADENKVLMNDVVIIKLFQFLNLKETVNCRRVCRKWNSIAQPYLRKRVQLTFTDVQPSTFLNAVENTVPDLEINAFQFLSGRADQTWQLSEFSNFFEKWGPKIHRLRIGQIHVVNEKHEAIRKYDITPWIDASRFSELNITCGPAHTQFIIPLDKLVSLKSIVLAFCPVNVRRGHRIAPVNLSFYEVSFHLDGNLMEEFNVHDFVDFSKLSEISISRSHNKSVPVFDIGRQVYNLRKIHLCMAKVKNWAEAKGSVRVLTIIGSPLRERNQLKVKEMYFDATKMSFSCVPTTVEKMALYGGEKEIYCEGQCDLPNLKSLSLTYVIDFGILAKFANCENLKQVFIYGLDRREIQQTLNVANIPKSIQRMEVCDDVRFFGNTDLNLEILVLIDYSLSNAQIAISKVLPQILVISWNNTRNETPDSIVPFVQENSHLSKIVFGAKNLHRNADYATSRLSKIVDKKSDYYEFKNQFGTSLTSHQFEILTFMSTHI